MQKTIYKISRVAIKIVLDRLKKRDETEKGGQPELVLGCFYNSGRTDNKECLKCRLYEPTCQGYLRGFNVDYLLRDLYT